MRATLHFLFISSFLLATGAQSQTPPPARSQAWQTRMESSLGLSAEQKKQVQSIQQKYAPELSEKHTKVQAARAELSTAMKDPKKGKSHESVILGKFNALQDAMREAHNTRFRMTLEIRELLTAEQLIKFQEFRDSMGPQMGGPGPHGRGAGQKSNPANLNGMDGPL